MNRQEAVVITRWVKANWPSQHIDEFTTEAMFKQLANYRLADAEEAVDNLTGRGLAFCAPSEIRAEVKRIRRARITADGDQTPPPGLTDEQEREWIADRRRRAADGEPLEAVDYGELVTGPSINFRELLPTPDTEETAP